MGGYKRALVFGLAAAVMACSGEENPSDPTAATGDGDGDGSIPDHCVEDRDCTDGRFCNGEEVCDPESDDADEFGCIEAAAPPCSSDDNCNEDDESCGCAVADADDDGHDSIECGGDDCDDMDAGRNPGQQEVCDSDHRDEDCDPNTYGYRDQDGDDDPDAECCNSDPDGEEICGTDCDDNRGNRHSFNTETCDGIDNDCDDLVDESPDGTPDGLKTLYTVDMDGDGFGSDADDADTALACERPDGYSETADDCDDDESEVSPSAMDSCNDTVDNDCSGTVNDPMGGCACVGNESRKCSEGGWVGQCAAFDQQCNDGVWDDCPLDVNAEAEVCDGFGVDEDCDGLVDEAPAEMSNFGLRETCYVDLDEDGFAASTAGSTLLCSCGDQQTTVQPTNEATTDCADNPAMDVDAASKSPGNTELCDGFDNNCDDISDGVIAENDLQTTFYHDDDGDGFGGEITTTNACANPNPTEWYVSAQDCNDGDFDIKPTAEEQCNGIDQDCDELADADDPDATNNCDVTGQIESAVCAVDQCIVDDCSGTYLDCDANYDCETDGATDYNFCGDCMTSCYQHCRNSSCDEFVQIEGGGTFTCARTTSGLVRCWGENDEGQIGDSSVAQRASPTATSVVANVIDISVGWTTSCAASSSTVWCWGVHRYGELGTSSPAPGSGVYSSVPLPVSGITSPTDIAVGSDHVCVTHNSGGVSCWGRNRNGQLGNESVSDTTTPQTVATVGGGGALSNVIALTSGRRHSCAIVGVSTMSTSGQVVCWGDNEDSQLGDGESDHGNFACNSDDCSWAPVQVSSLSDAVAIAAGGQQTCAIRTSGQVVCWGQNSEGQLGNGTTTNSNTPVNVTGVTNATAIRTHAGHSCAINGGAIACWGLNDAGQLGDGMTHSTCLAGDCAQTAVTLAAPVNSLSAIGTGSTHTCAVATTGQTYCWGNELNGRLGNGTTDEHDTPYPVIREP